jgi:hypothetical protein
MMQRCARLLSILVLGTTVLSAADAPSASDAPIWNFTRVGEAVLPDGSRDPQSYSKLAPWPDTDGQYLYSGCYDPAPLFSESEGRDRCFFTVDLSNPDKPVRSGMVPLFDPLTSPPPPNDHPVWKSDYPYPNLPARSPCKVNWNDPEIRAGRQRPECWDPGWNTHTHYVARGPGNVLAVNLERYHAFDSGTPRQQSYHGVRFYDIADRAHPKYLSTWNAPAGDPDPKTGVTPAAGGVHHFNFDGPYLYIGSEYRGFVSKILVILDVRDPSHPVEAGKWWVPGQKTPEEDAIRNWEQVEGFSAPIVKLPSGKWRKHVGMHYVVVSNDRAYLSYHQAGLVILDVKDKQHPKLLAHDDYLVPGAEPDSPDRIQCRAAAGGQDAACGNAHSAKLVPGRSNLLLMTDEYFTCPYGHIRMFDVADPTQPKLLSHFALPENTECSGTKPMQSAHAEKYPRRGPSTHIGNFWNGNLFILAWYGAGVRAVDITDPMHLQEVGRYQYDIRSEFKGNPLADHWVGQDTYDVIIGPGGRLYASDGTAGLRVLRYTGPGAGPRAR